MKKIFSYIFILIIAIILPSPAVLVNAQGSIVGICTHTTSYGTTTTRETIQGLCVAPDSWQLKTTSLPTPVQKKGPQVGIGICTHVDPITKMIRTRETIQGLCVAPDSWQLKTTSLPSPDYVVPADTYYHFLAPLPCDKNKDGAGCSNNEFATFNFAETNPLSTYLNIMIRIFIGICAVLAVIMIVVGGMEYMTSELISNKEHGKERITNAIFGLILALGAYTLLFTINPNLLNVDLSKLENVTVKIALGEAIQSDAGKVLPTGPLIGCTSGMKTTKNGMFACGDGNLVQNIDNMLDAAAKAGINLTGGGYRSPDEQKALRITNCNGDYTNPNAPCKVPTALPNLSNHNNGKAFDLRCDGTMIQTKDNKCFLWLKDNAAKYGLQNLIDGTEPWHWSVDGH